MQNGKSLSHYAMQNLAFSISNAGNWWKVWKPVLKTMKPLPIAGLEIISISFWVLLRFLVTHSTDISDQAGNTAEQHPTISLLDWKKYFGSSKTFCFSVPQSNLQHRLKCNAIATEAVSFGWVVKVLIMRRNSVTSGLTIAALCLPTSIKNERSQAGPGGVA